MSSPVEQIKSRLNIMDVVGSYIKLQKAGSNFKANCPFHNEKTPSFVVSPSREIWHCFGCGKGGDLIRFVMEIEGTEFPEALQLLAARAGITLKHEDPRLRTERTRLFDLLDRAAAFYESVLASYPAALDYLKSRGLEDGTIKDFRIGFAPDAWESALNHLKNLGFRDSEIEKAGLSIRSEKNTSKPYYDRFRSRIMFPISDSSGRIVGFSGRIFQGPSLGAGSLGAGLGAGGAGHIFQGPSLGTGGAEPAKYINTPQTILYDKSKTLYGFDKAKNQIRKENFCIIVEGQMDVVMSHQSGVQNAIAVSGTALTPYHLSLIKRLTDNLITAFDMDSAGGMATKRGIDSALTMDMEVRVAVLPATKDPADLIKEDAKLWKSSIQGAKHILDFYMDMLNIKYADNEREFRNKTAKLVLPYIAMLNSEVDKAHWVGEVSRRLKIKEEPIWDEIKKYKKNSLYQNASEESESAQNEAVPKSRKQLLEERVLGFAVWKGAKLKNILTNHDDAIFSEDIRSLLKAVVAGNVKQYPDKSNYLNKLAFEVELLYADTTKDLDGEIEEMLAGLEREYIKEQMSSLTEEIREAEIGGNHDLLQILMGKFKELSRKLL